MKSDKAESTSWYLVVTKPQSEFKAQENLLRQGYQTYLPIIKTPRQRNGKKIEHTEAFFSRYLFISLDKKADNWAPICSTIGVNGMVRFGGKPAQVPNTLIDNLMNNEDEFGCQSIEKAEFKQGEKINIIGGPFKGYKAVFKKMNSSERVLVLLDILGKNTQVTLSVDKLETT